MEPKSKVVFFPEQVKALEEAFPNRVLATTATYEEMQRYFATRQVVEWVRSKASGNV